MWNKRATGKALRGARRVRHRGITYWVQGHGVWYEIGRGELRYLGHMWFATDARRGIDRILSGERRLRLPGRKRRRFGRIHPVERY